MSAPTTTGTWRESLDALRFEADRVTTLMRSIGSGGEARCLGEWTVTEVATHLSQVWLGIPAMARGDWSEAVAQLNADANSVPVAIRDFTDLDRFTTGMVRAENDRDFAVLADRIDRRAAQYFGECESRDPEATRPWLIDGITVPVTVFTDHLLSETVVHGRDIAVGAGRSWRTEPAHARLALQRFLLPTLQRLDPRAAVNEDIVRGVHASYEIRIRGGDRFRLLFDDGAMHVTACSDSPVDCYVSADPVALLLLVWARQSQWPAIGRGKVVAWGRKPWLALRLSGLLRSP